MSCIRILPDDISNRIAAGEVIERPASVVKELLENAIDAGAKRISVQTTQGGRRLIQVSDDGSGMDRDDAVLCVEAHATSKIREAADIERISTLGFRGEALPSIAAVSRLQLQTRLQSDTAGTEILIEAGTLRDVRDAGCAPGTSVRVTHLFANLPARRKFLQSPATEDAHIQETVLLQALAHPGVAFDLTMDGRQVLHVSSATDLGTRVGMLLGREVYAAMIPVEYEEEEVRVTGLIARPGFTRAARREQRLFVNGRPAAAQTIYGGLRSAYHTLVMKGRYPPVALYFHLAPERVDVNVHPAKREVRFRESRLIGQVTAAAVRRALRSLAGELTPTIQPEFSAAAAPAPFTLGAVPDQQHLPWELPSVTPPAARPELGQPEEAQPASGATQGPPDATRAASAETMAVPPGIGRGPAPSAATRAEIASLRVIGVLGNTFLVAEGASGLVLVDQHAAHERIVFEQLLTAARSNAAEQQQLLLPVTVDLPPADAALLEKYAEHFKQLGFSIDAFGGNTFLVSAVPAAFPEENVGGLLRDILDDLRHGSGQTAQRPDDARIARVACKHAVKASDPLADGEISQLLQDLARAEMPYTCPHGRPVMISLPFQEIERRFGRQG